MQPTFLLFVPSPQVALHYSENVNTKSEEESAEGGQCCTFNNGITAALLRLLLASSLSSPNGHSLLLEVYASKEN